MILQLRSGANQIAVSSVVGSAVLQKSSNKSNIGEEIALTANGSRLRFTREVVSIVLGVNAVERVTYAALGEADTISLADLSGTAIRQVALDLGGAPGIVGDGQPDTISILAQTSNAIATTLGPGTMGITWGGVRYSVTGLETPNDWLIVQTAAGIAPTIVSAIETESGGVDR